MNFICAFLAFYGTLGVANSIVEGEHFGVTNKSLKCSLRIEEAAKTVFGARRYEVSILTPQDLGSIFFTKRDIDEAQVGSMGKLSMTVIKKFTTTCPDSLAKGELCYYTTTLEFFDGNLKSALLTGVGDSGFGGFSTPPPFSLFDCLDIKK